MMLKPVPTLPADPFSIPKELAGLDRLAMNLYWSWHPEAYALFVELAAGTHLVGANPVRILRESDALERCAKDRKFAARVKAAVAEFDGYLADQQPWFAREPRDFRGPAAYFCAEYGLHETFNLYSGGLGILAGDHVKECSDLGLPFVAVGLFYRRGFFRQLVDATGRQEHLFPTLDPDRLPLEVVSADGKPLIVEVPFPMRTVRAQVWRVLVGRTNLLLLDTDLPQNAPEDRPITSQLYTSGRAMRLAQEVVLGVGGARALAALGIAPSVWHMNEGHSSLLLLERIRDAVAKGKTFETATQEIRAASILTIHTPVPAGNERFDAADVAQYAEAILAGTGVTAERILQLGLDSEKTAGVFDMTGFAVRLSRAANGVSLLHGKTADRTWHKIGGYRLTGVTNGVHMPTWLGPDLRLAMEDAGAAFQRETALGLRDSKPFRPAWSGAADISDEGLWLAHLAQKRALVEFARARIFDQRSRHGEGPDGLREILGQMDPDALIIGFARRFATYKRATLLFSDERRLLKLLNAKGRKVQIVFAGKAHPADRAGQAFIQKVYDKTVSDKFRGKVFFLEEYDMSVGRALVQGVDVWLNNPRRPLEASGTSGMKAAANGVPNLSILDGWWDEACDERKAARNGWAIGDRKMLKDEKAQDKIDAEALFAALEQLVIPAYFDRDADGLPREWIRIMRNSIASSVWAFSTARMIQDYVAEMYA